MVKLVNSQLKGLLVTLALSAPDNPKRHLEVGSRLQSECSLHQRLPAQTQWYKSTDSVPGCGRGEQDNQLTQLLCAGFPWLAPDNAWKYRASHEEQPGNEIIGQNGENKNPLGQERKK